MPEINASWHRGLVTVASPASKRIVLALITLETARLPHVTASLRLSLVGSWTSAALFRRPLMSIFSSVYEVAPAGPSFVLCGDLPHKRLSLRASSPTSPLLLPVSCLPPSGPRSTPPMPLSSRVVVLSPRQALTSSGLYGAVIAGCLQRRRLF